MTITSKLGISAAALATLLTTATFAQEAEDQVPGQMMQNQGTTPGSIMGGEMSGMMQMMQQMGPMMEQCTEMMAAMNEQMKSAPNGQDDDG